MKKKRPGLGGGWGGGAFGDSNACFRSIATSC